MRSDLFWLASSLGCLQMAHAMTTVCLQAACVCLSCVCTCRPVHTTQVLTHRSRSLHYVQMCSHVNLSCICFDALRLHRTVLYDPLLQVHFCDNEFLVCLRIISCKTSQMYSVSSLSETKRHYICIEEGDRSSAGMLLTWCCAAFMSNFGVLVLDYFLCYFIL